MTTILLLIHLWSMDAGFATVQGDAAVVEETPRPLRDPIPYASLTMEKAMAMCQQVKHEYRRMPSVQVECHFYEVQMHKKTKEYSASVSIHRIGGMEREP